ncbi:GGDEF domain-containing protein [Enterobacter kobei]|uniref:Diguanylate cyclase n=2 Tax=Enterobacter kobei TaxID=208224 RepID=A0ACC8SBU0_9ENTR|nr:sensor domain-containing diguanylate cyclase [Enterobacter kobei]OLR20962.1 diguanylate cyclase [Enterobacter kobei]WNP32752.1 sensor domain-containing diguanylate cyclase [Enterobacter kobei]BCU55715.1 GGDEF domain-containing protein [Enterobacter kobei]SIR72739.1 diguanylate cyclase (GGDEF) domain-containing protein [Enterobacter kobei]
MKHPEIPPNESQRMASLHESGLLETASHERFDRLTRLAKRMFDVPIALVSLVGDDALHFISCDGIQEGHVERKISFCGHVILNDTPMVVADARADPRFSDNPLVTSEPFIRFYAGYPLRVPDGANVGSFCIIDRKPREFAPPELAVLKDFAAIVEDEFATISVATTDGLTGLYNRRGFENLAKFAITAARRRAEPLTLAWIDLNRFKYINDTWGHEEGDNALKAVAALLRESFREADLLVRFGGDEFAVLFSDTTEDGAWVAMTHLVEQAEAFNQTSQKPWKLSFSWGVSEYDHQSMPDIKSWLKTADDRMYAMKTKSSASR